MNHCKDDETGDEVYWTVKEGAPVYNGDTGEVIGYLGEDTDVKVSVDDARVARDPWGAVASQINQIGKHMEERLKESIRQKIKAPETFQRKAECANFVHIDSPTVDRETIVEALRDSAGWAEDRYSKPEFDAVDKPSHYAEGRKYEPIEVIEDWGLGMHLGNATKYISRAGRKGDELEDLKKARWYIDRRIQLLEDGES